MQQVLDHPYMRKNQEAYANGYEEWLAKQIPKLVKLVKKHAVELSKVPTEHKD